MTPRAARGRGKKRKQPKRRPRIGDLVEVLPSYGCVVGSRLRVKKRVDKKTLECTRVRGLAISGWYDPSFLRVVSRPRRPRR